MLSLRPLARRFLRCDVSDGQSSSFWFDHWLDLGPLIDVVGQDGPQLMGIPIESRVSDAGTSRGWRLPPSRTRNQSLAAVRDCLLRTPLPSSVEHSDCFEWIVPGDTASPPVTLLKRLVFQATIYLIWRERNSRLHAGPSLLPSLLFRQIDRCIKDAILARLNRKGFRNLLSLWFAHE
ncbi:unnamed protein product [Brassica rapa]|uniref:Reverse transcriptase zinc-binding domain-containing protein n=1 Tax=Brassica campestris TaxID=3711 RepID=A0A8D9H0C5_BRACM|nr:unnamed protein product [Brassica rapa]